MTIVNTPTSPHPKAQVCNIDLSTGLVRFNWLDGAGSRVDSGNSFATFAPGDDLPTDNEIAAAIEASTA